MERSSVESVTVRGIGASAGIAAGPALLYRSTNGVLASPAQSQSVREPAEEIRRLTEATAHSAAELRELVERVRNEVGEEESGIFEAQAMMLEDPTIIERATELIERQHLDAATALQQASEEQAAELAALEDPVWQARATDVRDAAGRAIRYLRDGGEQTQSLTDRIARSAQPVIVVADDLTPSDTVQMPLDRVAGLVLARGSTTAHAAILARARGLAAVLGVGDSLWELVAEGEMIALDGTKGMVTIRPGANLLAEAREAMEARQKRAAAASAFTARWRERSGITRDGHAVPVMANVGSIEDARLAAEAGAEGIGLLRTEFLFAQSKSLPTEAEQVEIYRTIIETLGKNRGPIIIRTLDAGADKPLASLAEVMRDLPAEENPALGVRGIRLQLRYPELLRTQLRAIVRAASETGADVHIMLPMVSSVDEVLAARRELEAVTSEIAGAPGPLPLGIMVETPAAVMLADVLAREAAFFSVGSNDLTQYVLAADRLNAVLVEGCRAEHPAVLRAIAGVASAASAANREAGVCGEMAGEPHLALLLAGFGITELSMNPARIPYVREALAQHRLPELRVMAEHTLEAATLEEALARIAAID